MLKVGIVGCGVIAPSHVKGISETEGTLLYAVCDIVKERADVFAEKHGAKKVYYDYAQMLKDKDIDIIAVCTPSGIHGEMAIAAIKAGKHIVCEKPMEITTEKLNAVVNSAKKSNVKFSCVFQRRFSDSSVKIKKAIENGDLGKILVADTYLKYYRSAEYYKSGDWRATWEMDGGGALMNQGVHGIDLMSWLMGGINTLYTVARTQLHDIKVEDAALSVVQFNNGAIGVMEGTTCVNPAQSTRFEIHGERGSIIFDDSGIKLWQIDGKDYASETASDDGSGSDPIKALSNVSHTPIYQDLVHSIQNDTQTAVPPEEGRRAVETILAMYKSSKEKREIKL